jgi:hypothetical protein
LRLRANIRRWRAPVLFQAGIPAADLLPGLERGQLYIGTIFIGVMFFLLFVFILVVVIAFEMRTGPVINTPAIRLGDLGIHAGLAFQLERAASRDVHVQGFIQIDVALVKIVFGPELSSGQRCVDHRDHVVFQNLARA